MHDVSSGQPSGKLARELAASSTSLSSATKAFMTLKLHAPAISLEEMKLFLNSRIGKHG